MNAAWTVLLGGAVGAPLRYLIDLWVQERHNHGMPWGTLTVNVIGTFVLGLVLGVLDAGRLDESLVSFLGTGVCGALTTYSTFSIETVRLAEDGRVGRAASYVGLSLAFGALAGLAGWALALLIT